MDELFQVDDPIDPEFDELIQVDEAEEEPGEAASPAPGNRDAEIEQLRQSLANMEKRLGDTQASFHQANQGKQFAEEIIRAQRQDAYEMQRQRAAAAAMAPPEFTEEEREAWLSDPAALGEAMRRQSEYARQRTLAEVGPVVARLERAARLVEPMVHRAILGAEQDARVMAKGQWGIDDAEFTQLAPYADSLLQQAARNDEDSYKAMRLDPGVIATAMAAARTRMQGGVPVNRSPRAPSIGAGGSNGGARGGGQRMPGRLAGVASTMERKLGLDSGTIANAPVRTRPNTGRL